MVLFRSFKNMVKRFDFMSSGPTLKIEGKNSYETFIGGFISCVLVILSIIGAVYFGKELWQRKQAMVVDSSLEATSLGPFKIKPEVLDLYVGIQFANHTYTVDDRIFSLKATFEVNEFLESGQKHTVHNLEIDFCRAYHTKEEIGVNTDLFFCVKPGEAQVENYWGKERSSLVKYKLFKCVNLTENNNHCFPQDEIDGALEGGVFSLFATNSFLDLNDPDFPVKKKNQNFFMSLSNIFSFSYLFSVKALEFEDDKGFLLENVSYTQYPYIDTPLVLYYEGGGNFVGQAAFIGDKFGRRIHRNYSKIQDVLTRLGGLLKALSIIGSLLTQVVSELEFFADSLFNFKYRLNKHLRGTKEFEDLINNESAVSNIQQTKQKPYLTSNIEDKDKWNGLKKNNFILNTINKNINPVPSNMEEEAKKQEDGPSEENQGNIPANSSAQPNSMNSGLILAQVNNKLVNINNEDSNKNNKEPSEFNHNKEKADLAKKDNRSIVDKDFNTSKKSKVKKMTALESSLAKKLTDNKSAAVKLQNESPVRKNIVNIDVKGNDNLSLISSTTAYYSSSKAFSDFAKQLLGLCRCKSEYNRRFLIQKHNYQSKISKVLSLNYLMKRCFMVEYLSKSLIPKESQEELEDVYLNQLYRESPDQKVLYDDSEAFGIEIDN